MSRIIISYRPTDSQAITHRIYDQLCNTYGDDAVVLGAKALLRAGDDYMVTIPTHIQEAQALVVVIGSDWTAGEWLSDETDMDRIAIAAALQGQVRVVPVLVNGAIMPSAVNLPDDLQSLTRRVALSMSDATFRQDAPALVDSVMPSASPPPQPPATPPQYAQSQPPSPSPIYNHPPPISPVYGQTPSPAPPLRSGQAGPSTQTLTLDPETVRLIVTGFAAIAGILMIIATGAFSWVGIENVGSATPLDIIEESPRTIDYILLLIPISGVAFIAVAVGVFTRRLKTEHSLLSIAGIAALLFCVPFLWRFLNNRDYRNELENAGYSPAVIDRFLDSASALYSLAEFIWIPVGILVMAIGGWWFLRSRPQLHLTTQPSANSSDSSRQPPQLALGGQQPYQQPAAAGFAVPAPEPIVNPTYFQPAGLIRRFTAFIIDMMIVSVAVFALFVLFFDGVHSLQYNYEYNLTQGYTGLLAEKLILYSLFNWMVAAPYQFFFLAQSGQTPGMKVVNISVVPKEGALTIGTVIMRTFIGHTISALVGFLGYISALFDSENRTWHDHLTNTIVVDESLSLATWYAQNLPNPQPRIPPRY